MLYLSPSQALAYTATLPRRGDTARCALEFLTCFGTVARNFE